MPVATIIKNPAKIRRRGFGFNRCASLAPIGAVIKVIEITTKNATTLT